MMKASVEISPAAVIVVAVIAASGLRADEDHDNKPNRYVATKLTRTFRAQPRTPTRSCKMHGVWL
jgi:hypothetical protein